MTSLNLEPIGVLRTHRATKAEAARQPCCASGSVGVIELLPGRNFEHALEDLAGWEMLWVIFWFHLNPSWRPKVLPPRSTSGRKGVFATRSPHRPNPLGLSAVRLERVEGLRVFVRDLDLLDGTPVLDLKPYVPYTDAYPLAQSGWLEQAGGARADATVADPAKAWRVSFSGLAAEQCAWVQDRTGLPLRERVADTLALGPQPHAYRRIRREGTGFRLSVKEWRIAFRVDQADIIVMDVSSGYRSTQLAGAGAAADDPLAAHRAFIASWPDRTG